LPQKGIWLETHLQPRCIALSNRVFHGTYEAELTNVIARIREFRNLWEARLGIIKSAFVETSLAQQIFEVCDLARAYQTVVPIYGDSHTGKTTALEEYTRTHNHGSTIYVRMPAKGALGKFLIETLKSMNLQQQGNSVVLANRVIGGFTDQKLLIVDEVHQTCLSQANAVQLGTIEFTPFSRMIRVPRVMSPSTKKRSRAAVLTGPSRWFSAST